MYYENIKNLQVRKLNCGVNVILLYTLNILKSENIMQKSL